MSQRYILQILGVIAALYTNLAFGDVFLKGYSGSPEGKREVCQWRIPIGLFNQLSKSQKIQMMRPCYPSIDIVGEIRTTDGGYFEEFMTFYDAIKPIELFEENKHTYHPQIFLNTPGGSIVSAIKIAKAIRQSEKMQDSIGTHVVGDDVCYSACVIILAGSYSRNTYGPVGIHRPHFVGEEYIEWGYDDMQSAYTALYDVLSDLFIQANLSRRLVDDMFAIPSNELRILSKDELNQYGLSKDDLVIQEQKFTEMRTVCGRIFDGLELLSDEAHACLEKTAKARTKKRVLELTSKHCGRALTNPELMLPKNEDCVKKLQLIYPSTNRTEN